MTGCGYMRTFETPVVAVSTCLGYETCRYNGEMIQDPILEKIKPYVKVMTVCPEVGIGLGTPRQPLRLIAQQGSETRFVQPATGRDYTKEISHFTEHFLLSMDEVDGFILKSRSPSCAMKDAKIYAAWEGAPVIGKSSGMFGREVIKRFGCLAIEDEGRLKNKDIREHFLLKLFTLSSFRALKRTKSIRSLVEFQSKNKYLWMALHQKKQKELGYIAANPEKKSLQDVFENYEQILLQLLAQPTSRGSISNVLLHIMGYFSKQISSKEKGFLLTMIDRYRSHQVPLSNPLAILRSWAIRFEHDYLLYQTFFEPFPVSLVDLEDSGKGRSAW